jgi:D-3-phosphoglycerate dehydrogenase
MIVNYRPGLRRKYIMLIMEVVILDSGYKSYDFEKEIFEKNGIWLRIFPGYTGNPREKMDFAQNADGILVRHTVINEAFLAGMNNLKAIVRYGVGYDNVDIEACTKYGVKAANVQGYANHSVSDHALALMFSCIRGMWNTRAQLQSGFGSPPVHDIFELNDKMLGIIGIGRIGSLFCRKASPLFAGVLACDPYKPESHFRKLAVQRIDLDGLLERSDVISIHCNLTNETRYLLNSEQFLKMLNKPVIINTSRGEVINEVALLEALNSGKIHSAGIDVFEDEPLTDKQTVLVNYPRIICTGHYAWYSDKASVELQRRAAFNLLNLLKGNTVEDCLNC